MDLLYENILLMQTKKGLFYKKVSTACQQRKRDKKNLIINFVTYTQNGIIASIDYKLASKLILIC